MCGFVWLVWLYIKTSSFPYQCVMQRSRCWEHIGMGYLHIDSVIPAAHTPGLHSRSARPSSCGRKDLQTEVETPAKVRDRQELLEVCLDCRSNAWAGLEMWDVQFESSNRHEHIMTAINKCLHLLILPWNHSICALNQTKMYTSSIINNYWLLMLLCYTKNTGVILTKTTNVCSLISFAGWQTHYGLL